MLKLKYDNFKMLPNESINDMFTRFTDTTNHMQGLGHFFIEEYLVKKALYSLNIAWLQKWITIEESYDLVTIIFEELKGKLMANEVQLNDKDKYFKRRKEEKVEKAEKGMVFKTPKKKDEVEFLLPPRMVMMRLFLRRGATASFLPTTRRKPVTC